VVVALEAVDLDRLDVLVADVQPGAEHALVGDDEVVVELGAMTITLSKPAPPSRSTGALTLYWMVSVPSPPIACVVSSVETPCRSPAQTRG